MAAILAQHKPSSETSADDRTTWLILLAGFHLRICKSYQAARRYLVEALRIAPSDELKAWALCELVYTARLHTCVEDARRYASRFADLPAQVHNPEVHRYQGRILADLAHAEAYTNNFGRALEQFGKALSYLRSTRCADPQRIPFAAFCQASLGWIMRRVGCVEKGRSLIAAAWPNVPTGWRTVVAAWGALLCESEELHGWILRGRSHLADATDPPAARAWHYLALAHAARVAGSPVTLRHYLRLATEEAIRGECLEICHEIQLFRQQVRESASAG